MGYLGPILNISHHSKLDCLSRWLVGKGEIKLLTDNCAGEVLYGPAPMDESLMVAQGFSITDDLWDLIPARIHALI